MIISLFAPFLRWLRSGAVFFILFSLINIGTRQRVWVDIHVSEWQCFSNWEAGPVFLRHQRVDKSGHAPFGKRGRFIGYTADDYWGNPYQSNNNGKDLNSQPHPVTALCATLAGFIFIWWGLWTLGAWWNDYSRRRYLLAGISTLTGLPLFMYGVIFFWRWLA